MPEDSVHEKRFGNNGKRVTCVGLGGEGILRTHGYEDAARGVIQEALDQGITYFDSARVYSDSERYLGSVWGKSPAERKRIFQTSKSAARDRKGALRELDETLERLQTDILDLWQIHDVRTEQELRRISGPGGALEAFVEAKNAGKVHRIGVTGHHDPEILTRAVMQWPIDAVMMPVNPVEEYLGGFLTSTLPAATERGLAVIAMKVMGASRYISADLGITPELLLRFALSKPITVAIVGCSSLSEVQTLADIGRNPVPPNEQEKLLLEKVFRMNAGRMGFYRGVL